MSNLRDFNPKDKGKVVLTYFSPARVALNTETNKHPVLIAQLLALDDRSWNTQLAEIAAYCNVIMDGLYSQEDLEILYPQLTTRMADTRLSYSSGIILNSTTLP
jgi:hypothetical protein